MLVLNNLWKDLLRSREEVDQLLVNVLEAFLKRVLLKEDFHLAQRYFVQVGEDQTDCLVGTCPQSCKLNQPSDDEHQVVIVLLHYLRTVLPYLG